MLKTWRLIESGYNTAVYNMDLEKQNMQKALIPTLRFFGWNPPAVSIGCGQEFEEEIDLEKCHELGIDYVRRITAGGAVYHDKEVTYSITSPEDFFLDLHQSYKDICGAIILGLQKLGIKNVQYAPEVGGNINDILVNGKKISGCAQARKNGQMLHHGTILKEVEPEKMFAVLKIPDVKLKEKKLAEAKDRVTSIKNELGREVADEEVIEVMKEAFKEKFNIELQ